MKKLLYLLPFLIITIGINLNAQYQERNTFPVYIKSTFVEEYPFYAPDYEGGIVPLFQRIRYKELPPEVLNRKKERLHILNQDGVELINISGTWPNANHAQTETWMAVNPTNPNNMIATSNDNYYLSGRDGWRMTSYYTEDGGRTWNFSPTARNSGVWINNGGTIFDPGVAFDSQGNAYYCYGHTQTSSTREDDHNGVFVVKSTNAGRTWDYDFGGFQVMPVALTLANDNNPFHDRYTIAADPEPTSPHRDNVYVAWQRFRPDAVVFSRSIDGGHNWTPETTIGTGITQAPVPTTGPNGEVYVAWHNRTSGNNIQAIVTKSVNGGQSFSTPVVAQTVRSIGDIHPVTTRHVLTDKQNIRVSSYVQIAVDRSNTSTRGNVYLVQAGRESTGPEIGKYGIYLAKSTDGGNSWSKNIRVDANPHRNDMFFPTIACDPVTGLLAIFYYSSEQDPVNNQGVDGYVAVSTDAGDTWVNLRITDETWYLSRVSDVFPQGAFGAEGGNIYWGDYTSIVAYNNQVRPLFWMPDAPNHPSGDFGLNDLYTAILSPEPRTVTNLAAESIVAQNVDIHLTWVNPTKNQLGMDLNNFTIRIFRDGELLTELTDKQTNYTDPNVTDGQRYRYDVRVVTAQGTSAAQSVSIDAGGHPKTLPPSNVAWDINPNGLRLVWTNPSENIDGSEVRNISSVRVYDKEGNLFAEKSDGNVIQTGASVIFDIDTETEKFYELTLKVVTKRGTTEYESNASKTTIAYAGNALDNLRENFEDISNVIPHYIVGDWQYTDYVSRKGSHSLTDSDPMVNYESNLNSSNNAFYSAPVNVKAGATTFVFDHIALIRAQNYEDYAEIAVTDDYGLSWDVIKWIDRRTYAEGFTDDPATSDWHTFGLDFSKYIGKNIVFRFAITSNGFLEDKGWFIDYMSLDDSPVSVTENVIMSNMALSAFPNPTNNEAKLSFFLPMSANVDLAIYDALGNKIFNIDNSQLQPGSYEYNLELNNFASGNYFVRAYANGTVKAMPLVIVK